MIDGGYYRIIWVWRPRHMKMKNGTEKLVWLRTVVETEMLGGWYILERDQKLMEKLKKDTS